MRLPPRPILTEEQLAEMESRASPMFEMERRQFELYRACASDVRKATRNADRAAYVEATKQLEVLRCRLDWAIKEVEE